MNNELNEQEQVLAAVAQVREQWGGVISAVVAASAGNADAARQLDPFLDDMARQKEWGGLAAALRQILAGERNPLKLFQDLEDVDVLILSDILRALGVDPRLLPALPGEEAADDDDGGDMLSLEEFLQMVVEACQPGAPAELKAQMLQATQGMAFQAGAPPELNALGSVLNRMLTGERNPDLAALPPQLAEVVRAMLKEIKPSILLA